MPDYFELLLSGKEKKFLEKIDTIDVDQTNDLGRSLLHIAIANGQKRAASALISKGANPNLQDSHHGYTPLHAAAEYGLADLVEELIQAGADPNILDKHGNSPLWTAVFWSRAFANGADIVEKVHTAGGDPRHKNKSGRSPLDMAKQFEDDNLRKILSAGKKNRK